MLTRLFIIQEIDRIIAVGALQPDADRDLTLSMLSALRRCIAKHENESFRPNIWIVGHNKSETPDQRDNRWEFQGVFETKEQAVAACRSWRYFVGPQVLNLSLPDETSDWQGCYYPIDRPASHEPA